MSNLLIESKYFRIYEFESKIRALLFYAEMTLQGFDCDLSKVTNRFRRVIVFK